LLRLLLPLNDAVYWTSCDTARAEARALPQSEQFTESFNR